MKECICCLGESPKPHLAGLLRCADCTHVWADLSLSPDELRELYSGNYFKGGEYLDYEKEAPALRRNFARRVKNLAAHHPAGGRLFEIGAAYGTFLQVAAARFEVSGCDISEHAAGQARCTSGATVVAADYLNLPTPDKPFDVICMWDTLEHLARPDLYLEKAAREFAPGGTLALTTGDIASWVARARGARWRLIHPPTHLHYFTAESIRVLLARLGFAEVTIRYESLWRSVDAVAWRLLAGNGNRVGTALYRAITASGLTGWSLPVNLRDIMTVTARRPSRQSQEQGNQ